MTKKGVRCFALKEKSEGPFPVHRIGILRPRRVRGQVASEQPVAMRALPQERVGTLSKATGGSPRGGERSGVLWSACWGQVVVLTERLDEKDLLGLNLDISGLARGASKGLVDHDAGVGQRLALALSSGAEEEGTHGGSSAKAHGRNVARNVLHGVVDGHAGGDGAAGGVDWRGGG